VTTLNDICDALAAQIADRLPELNCYAEEIDDPRSPYVMFVETLTPLIEYHSTFEPLGTVHLQAKVSAKAARTPDIRRQIRDLLSIGNDSSVVDAIELKTNGQALDGAVEDITCLSAEITDDGVEIFGLIVIQIQA